MLYYENSSRKDVIKRKFENSIRISIRFQNKLNNKLSETTNKYLCTLKTHLMYQFLNLINGFRNCTGLAMNVK